MSMPLIVLAGGFGTRLKSVVKEVPKPLAPVRERPFLAYLLEQVIKEGAKDIVLSLYYQAELIQRFSEGFQADHPGLRLRTLVEPEALGTGGALKFALNQMDGVSRVAVMNGDTFLRGAYETTTKAVAEREGRGEYMGIVKISDSSRYGRVDLASDGRVLAFGEKGAAGPGWINCGVYNLSAEKLRVRPEESFSLERAVFPGFVERGELFATEIDSPFIDIGVPEDYRSFESRLSEFLS